MASFESQDVRERWSEPDGELKEGSLAVRTLGHGPPTLLLHGILGSNRYWGRAFDRLAHRGQVLAPDLLGFGASPRPAAGYGPEEHGAALVDSTRELEVNEKLLVVGHSLGALLALWLAWRYPDQVRGVVAFGPPLYRGPREARRHFAQLGGLERLFVLDSAVSTWAARKACENLCGARPRLAARLFAKLRPALPKPVLEDATRHSWASYSETLQRVILGAEGSNWLVGASVPTLIIAGTEDRYLDLAFLGELPERRSQLQLQVWSDEGHDLPLTRPDRCLSEIERWGEVTLPTTASARQVVG